MAEVSIRAVDFCIKKRDDCEEQSDAAISVRGPQFALTVVKKRTNRLRL